jgi:signal transduction histidine kinase
MLIIRYIIVFCFLSVVTASISQKDSLRVTQLLDSALVYSDKRSNYLHEVDNIETRNHNNLTSLSTIWILRSKYELRMGNVENARKIVENGKKKFNNQPRLEAHFYNLEGSIYATQKQFEKAILSYQYALRRYDISDRKKEAAYVKNNIANIFFNLNDFESAYSYAKESFDEVYDLKDTVYYPQIAAILAISEAKLNKLKLAEEHALLAISEGNKYQTPVAVIIGKYALGDINAQKKDWSKAKKNYQEVVLLSEQLKLIQYEAYGRIGLLSCNVSLKLFQEAITEGERVIELNNLLNLHFADYTVYQQLSEAYSAIGNDKKAFLYLRKANTMYREYSSIENKKAIQELLTKYETEKKERDLSQKELQLTRAVIWILALGFLLFLLTVLILWWRRRNLRRLVELKLEAERRQLTAYVEGEQRERERIAADIHDGIASTLTGLALQLQQLKSHDEIVVFADHLQSVRNEVRMISKNILPFNLKEEGWKIAFQRFASTVESSELTIFFIAEFDENQLNNQRGMVVYRILQELIQNTIKHANATECELLITEEKESVLIQYSDNGKGTTLTELEKGNGWQSVLTRLSAINGKITFPLNPFGGFKIDIYLPKL